MGIGDIFKATKNKALEERVRELEALMTPEQSEVLSLSDRKKELEQQIKKSEAEAEKCNTKITSLSHEIEKLTEIIENKKYSYEEFDVFTDLVFKNFSESELKNAKTRLYYNGNKLAYIKTIIGDYEELLKITLIDSVNSNLFEIPSNYQEG